MDYVGILIREKRLEKNWSQEGLCKGICAVSYLSKIEQGKTEASEEVLTALFKKLGIDWVTDEKILSEGKKFIEEWYESAFSGDYKKTSACFERFKSGRFITLSSLIPQAPSSPAPLKICIRIVSAWSFL